MLISSGGSCEEELPCCGPLNILANHPRRNRSDIEGAQKACGFFAALHARFSSRVEPVRVVTLVLMADRASIQRTGLLALQAWTCHLCSEERLHDHQGSKCARTCKDIGWRDECLDTLMSHEAGQNPPHSRRPDGCSITEDSRQMGFARMQHPTFFCFRTEDPSSR